MKTKTIQLILITLVVILGFTGTAQAGSCTDGVDTSACCTVLNNQTTGTSSIDAAITEYNKGRFCTDGIRFGINKVYISKTLTIDGGQDDSDGMVIGNDDDEITFDTTTLEPGEPIFVINKTNKITIKGFRLMGGDNPLVKCENDSDDLVIQEINFQNDPTKAIVVAGCQDVRITDIDVQKSTSANGQMISITDSNNVTIETINSEYKFSQISGLALNIDGVNDLTISGFMIDNSKGQVAKINNVEKLIELDVSATNVGTGIWLNNVNGKDGDALVTLDLQGNEVGSGAGLELDQNAKNLDFTGLVVRQFGGNGIEIRDSSDVNNFDKVSVYQNGGYGFFITDEAHNTEITNSDINNNGNCGIYLDSTRKTVVMDNDIYNNGQGCAVGTSNLELSDDTVKLIPLEENQFMLDIDRNALSSDATIELHYLTTNGKSGSTTDSSSSSSGRKVRKITKFEGLDIIGGILNGNGSSSGGSTSSSIPSDMAVGGSSSYIDSFSVQSLPDPNVSVTTTEGWFMAIVRDQNDYVVGVWTGQRETELEEDDLCYTDPNSGELIRVFVSSLDTDGDGLKDYEEDEDMDCNKDASETNPYLADSDEDGLDDRTELKVTGTDPNVQDTDNDDIFDGDEDKNGDGNLDVGETDPNKADTDGDGLTDGQEDADQDGERDANETDPREKDTDGDGENDNVDACPLLYGSEQCYYANCVEGVTPVGCDDVDGDGICSHIEDKNLNCKRDTNETDATSSDTDGDGISDGIEDYNRDGVFDEDETDPTNADTDGDCITDGNEDKNGDGIIRLSDGETDPKDTDSDGDGIEDGEEDFSCDGKVDAGETSPYLEDTDGDNENDDTDVCPWDQDPNCVVRYCGINGFEDYDTDGDSLPDAYEDANGDCKHTAANKESHPLLADTDSDGLEDSYEDCFGTNPNVADTDGDGATDYEEVKNSLETCEVIYSSVNGEASDPLYYNRGGCSLNPYSQATSSASLPIILLGLLMVPVMVLRVRKTSK